MRQLLALPLRLAPRPAALLAGACLGWIAWELSRVPDHGAFALAMAVVVLLAGSASFTCWSLHRQAQQGRPTRGDRLAHVRGCVSLLGCGVVVALNALQFTLA